MNSTEMIQAADVDYKMLKEKGKEGEEVLHYNGFLDGSAYGFTEAKRYYIDKACEWLKENARHILSAELRQQFRKAMEK